MDVRSARGVLVVALALVVASCSATPTTDSEEARCAEAVQAAEHAESAADLAVKQLEALVASGAVTVEGETTGPALIMAQLTGTTGQEATDDWASKQERARSQLRRMARLMDNDPSCFSPTDVAAAQELLDLLG